MSDFYSKIDEAIEYSRKTAELINSKFVDVKNSALKEIANIKVWKDKTYKELIQNRDEMIEGVSSRAFATTFRIEGDHEKFYPVVFAPQRDGGYSEGANNQRLPDIGATYQFTRYYSDWASKYWNNSTSHKAGLNLQIEASDRDWDAGFNRARIVNHWFVYQRTCAGVQWLSTSQNQGFITVYLRGQGEYTFISPHRYNVVKKSWSTLDDSNNDASIGGVRDLIIIDDALTDGNKAILEKGKRESGNPHILKLPKAFYTKDEVYSSDFKLAGGLYHVRREADGTLKSDLAYVGTNYKQIL